MSTLKLDLNGSWKLAFGPQQVVHTTSKPPVDWPVIDAQVPGNVEIDLMAAGILPDLAMGNNVYLLRQYEGYEWWYTRSFTVPAIAPEQSIELVFDGLDCIADVWLDGQLIGHSDNMLIPQRYDITEILRDNVGSLCELAIRIHSAVLEGRRYNLEPLSSAFAVNWESLSVRKAPHMYGWDILPRIVSAGLWRDVHLDISSPTRFRSIYVVTPKVSHLDRTATVQVDWDIKTSLHSIDNLRVRVSVAGASHEAVLLGTHGRIKLELRDVDLWWPRGYGQPTLYPLVLELLDSDGSLLDCYEERVGLRTAQLEFTDITLPDKPGEFVFWVNGVKIFVKGTNWVPLDALHSRDRLHLDQAMEMIADLNCNMVRCWGGNVYEDHAFFKKCDELGVMVWQDFALACAIYPQTDDFAAAIKTEAESIVKLLRNHPSLVLWAGNNEIDEAYAWSTLSVDPNTDRLSRDVLPAVVRRLDPYRPYLPSSPYRSPEYVREQRKIDRLAHPFNAQPEQHLWGPRTDFKGDYYTKSLAHFASEIGYHGCPDRRSLERFLDKEHIWPWQNNDQWLTHAARPLPGMHDFNYRIELMASQIRVLFTDVPDNLDDFVLASQISQAEAKKFFIEWFRQGKWRRTGILWWNLRDGWPLISDAVVDYYGCKKLAYEYIRRSQSSVTIVCCELDNGSYPIKVINDTNGAISGHVRVSDLVSGDRLLDVDCEVSCCDSKIVGMVSPTMRSGMFDLIFENIMPMRNHYLYGDRPYLLNEYKQWLSLLDMPSDIGPIISTNEE